MKREQKREIVATLLKAGRRDLAKQFVGVSVKASAQPPTDEKSGWTGGATLDRFRFDSATVDRYVRKDGAVLDWMMKFHGGSGQMSDFVRWWAPGGRSWMQSNMLFGQKDALKWLKGFNKMNPFTKAWQKTNTVEMR